MSTLVFKLRNVPEDEANEVRSLLESDQIELFETTAGNWGIGMPGLWVQDHDAQRARELIDHYQVARSREFRKEYEQAVARGDNPRWYSHFIKHPLATTGIVLFCLFIIYALVSPFVRLANS